MASFKVLALVLLVAFVTVDAKGCPDDIKKSHKEKVKQAEGKFEEVKGKLASGCDELKDLPAYKFFNKMGKKENCPGVGEDGAQTPCPKVLCAIKHFESKVDEFKRKLESAAADASCKDLYVKGVGRGLFMINHFEKTKEELNELREKEKEKRLAVIAERKAEKEKKKQERDAKRAEKIAEREKRKQEREAKKAEREAKKAEREAKKADREAKKAERQARRAEREKKKKEREARKAAREAKKAERQKKRQGKRS